jgi:hypothetical protein
MSREPELKIIRRAYAKQITAAGGVTDPTVEHAFAVELPGRCRAISAA